MAKDILLSSKKLDSSDYVLIALNIEYNNNNGFFGALNDPIIDFEDEKEYLDKEHFVPLGNSLSAISQSRCKEIQINGYQTLKKKNVLGSKPKFHRERRKSYIRKEVLCVSNQLMEKETNIQMKFYESFPKTTPGISTWDIVHVGGVVEINKKILVPDEDDLLKLARYSNKMIRQNFGHIIKHSGESLCGHG